jgi:hypothetical protein
MDYQRHYNSLMDRAKDRNLNCYKELHHIIPRCMGGSDDKDNLVYLTAAEHFVAHQLLLKMNPSNHGLAKACRLMTASSNGQIRNNKEFEWIKKKNAELMSKCMLGRRHSEKTKLKMSKSAKGKPKSESHKSAISKTLKGKNYITDKGRQKISDTHSGRIDSEETRKKRSQSINKINIQVTCPWCGKSGKLTGMKSWHFDRCKENPNGLQRAFYAEKS